MPLQVIRNNTIKNDDWMKTLPEYKDEVPIHNALRLKYQAKEGGSGSGNFGHSGVPGQQGGSGPGGKSVNFQPGTEKGDAFSKETEGWEGARASIGMRATSFGWNSMGAKGMAIVDNDGKLAAVAQVKTLSGAKLKEKFGDLPPGKYTEIMDLATREKGWGRQMMQDVVNKSAKGGTGIVLRSAGDAEPWYQKLGFNQQGSEPIYYLSPDDVQAYSSGAQENLPAVSKEDEPEEFIDVGIIKEGE